MTSFNEKVDGYENHIEYINSGIMVNGEVAVDGDEKPHIDYKYNEDVLINELQEYVDATYNQHYARTGIQTTEFIIDQGHGVGFCVGNINKYCQRYGKKDGRNRKDLLKLLHYALILLHTHDLEEESK